MGIKSDQAGTWYALSLVCHWPALGRQACKWIDSSRVWTKEAGAEKGARSVRSRELLKCGSHSQGDGKRDGEQWACQSFHQDLVPKYYVNGNTSSNFAKFYKQTNKKKPNSLSPWVVALQPFFLWLYTNVHVLTGLFVSFTKMVALVYLPCWNLLFFAWYRSTYMFLFHLCRLVYCFCLWLGNFPFYTCPIIYLINSFLDSLVKYIQSTDFVPSPVLAVGHSTVDKRSLCPHGTDVLIWNGQ